ncbi:hypothetical protein SETIT_2G277600v2 [Setaria italica]|uniref:Uncharacterized protein n=1 Tax=Setaria italica TaxID=4555 RepID=A0A368Q3D5_SETIT|nr:hypothetical protein SETIT_2G277600v2 [Setaria italica]
MGVPQGPVASPVTIRPAEVEIEPVAGVLDRSEALEPPIWGWRSSSWLDSAGHGGCARSGEEGPSVGRQGLSGGMAQGVQGRSSSSSQRRRGSASAGVLGGRSTGGGPDGRWRQSSGRPRHRRGSTTDLQVELEGGGVSGGELEGRRIEVRAELEGWRRSSGSGGKRA